MVDEGADIVDVGGESTRPGAAPVTESEEVRRVVPVIKELARTDRTSAPGFRSIPAKQWWLKPPSKPGPASSTMFRPHCGLWPPRQGPGGWLCTCEESLPA